MDRFDTAAKIATATFTTASTVVVANGDRVIDAQAAGYIAGQQASGAPILLTQAGSVPQFTLDAIKKLGATKAIVIGDDTSVSPAARAQMTAAGLTLTVIAGDNRFDTAADIYNSATTKAKTVFLARGDYLTGQVSPDALAAGPIAYKGTPILLTNSTSLPAETKAAIISGGVTKVVVLGNTINDAVKAELTAISGVSIETIAGDDRSLTARKLAESTYGSFYNKTSAAIANGERVDALSAGPWAATKGTPILLTLGTNSIGTGTTGYLDANKATLTSATVFGDAKSVPTAFTTAAKTAGGGDVANLGTIAVSPSAAASFDATATLESPNVTTDDRAYTATGLTDGTQYRVTLVNAANVTVTNGVATFAVDRTPVTVTSTNPNGATGQQVSGNYLAAPGTVTSRFLSVNGGAPANNTGPGTGSAPVTNSIVVSPVNGAITFTVDADAPESIVPVVYVNGGTGLALTAGGPSPRLELNAQGVPVESFGLGGTTTFNAAPAVAGTVSSTAVASVNKDGNTLVLGTGSSARTYAYDSGDTFAIAGTTTDLAGFEAALNRGDSVTISPYTPSGQSVFNIATNGPTLTVAAAAGVSASTNDITVTVTPSASATLADYTSFIVERQVYGTSTWTTVATVAPAQDANTAVAGLQYVDNDVAAGTYLYRASAVIDGVTTTPTTTTSTVESVTPTATTDADAPLAVDTIVTTNGPVSTALDANDVFKVVYNEAVGAPVAGDTFRLTDGNGTPTIADVVNGTNATFALNTAAETVNRVSRSAGTVLTVTLTGNPNASVLGGAAGTTAGLQFPVTVAGQTGTADVVGNNWVVAAGTANTANAQDIVIEASGDTENTSTDVTGPTLTAGPAVVGATTVSFTSDEPLDATGGIIAGDFDTTGTTPPTVTSVALSSDGRIVTVTLSGGLVAGNTVRALAGQVEDANGNGIGAIVATAPAA